MVGFGCDNKELGRGAPFMLAITDNLDHELRVVVSASFEGEPSGEVNLDDWPQSMRENIKGSEKLQEMIANMVDVWASTEDAWEIDIDGYVLFMERTESYTTWDDYEIRRGWYLIEFERSRLLDDLAHYTFANNDYPGPLKHYGIYCEGHVLDVVTDSVPVVRKLSSEEIQGWGIGTEG